MHVDVWWDFSLLSCCFTSESPVWFTVGISGLFATWVGHSQNAGYWQAYNSANTGWQTNTSPLTQQGVNLFSMWNQAVWCNHLNGVHCQQGREAAQHSTNSPQLLIVKFQLAFSVGLWDPDNLESQKSFSTLFHNPKSHVVFSWVSVPFTFISFVTAQFRPLGSLIVSLS